MNIDPRMLKELLRMQLLYKTNILSDKSSGAGNDESEFSELLNDLLSQNTDNSMFNRAASVPVTQTALKPSGLSPLFASASSYRTGTTAGSLQAAELDPLIQEAGRRHQVQPSLVKAVIDAESSFNSKAVSQAGAKGLMQLMDATGKSVGVNDPFDPVQNVQGGTKYLSNLLKKYDGNQGVALAAYNAGSGRIDRLGIANDNDLAAKMSQLPKETQAYVAKVMNLQRSYEG
ncbi:Transglycosylase SLT domain-containing protein [Paenibacillus sp. 1_12]|uniref:lytic transglycosylase domain-containing protein n=1 Tax=Paenibacillus sp. 1_12 TaxID=1566278 RepID=UPI0008F0F223|nr:lytic transglycosylase domain-containing protein [Paenibacillus sp. 1_12]SFL32493.1 Transglycosylase SLT domain-containing protein [Paenibacillus sp. 1_12]